MQKDFRKWITWIVAFLLCFSFILNIHFVLLLFRYRQIYQAPPVWVSDTGELVTSSSHDSVAPEPETTASIPSAEPIPLVGPEDEAVTEGYAEPKQTENPPTDSQEAVITAGTTVYLTKSGSKFHRDGCSSLSKSKIAISYEDAVARGFEPCGRCKP